MPPLEAHVRARWRWWLAALRLLALRMSLDRPARYRAWARTWVGVAGCGYGHEHA